MEKQDIIRYDENLEGFEEVVLELPYNMSKTGFAKDLILKILKDEDNKLVQHKFIVKALESVLDPDGRRMFTLGNINGGFNSINRDLTKFNVVKFKIDGNVFYKYTLDPKELELNNDAIEGYHKDTNLNIEELTEEIKKHLLKSIDFNNRLKFKLLEETDLIDINTLDLMKKISELEYVLLQQNIHTTNR